jgi:parallel beta-helix repeat protein
MQIVSGVFTGDMHGNTYIHEDGSIEPPTAPIQRNGELYTITDDFHGHHLRVERSNVIVDGNGFTLYQNIILHHVFNVTIKNFHINNPEGSGIDLDHSMNNTITNNTIWGCGTIDDSMGPWGAAIFIHGEDSNLVYWNAIRNNLIGVIVYGSPNTVFFDNIFSENQFDVSDFGGLGFGLVPTIALFDNGERGNYWDNYSGNDIDKDGIGDSPHILDENNQDNYPLISPTDIPEFPSWTILPLLIVATLVGVTIRNKIKKKGL